MPGADIPAVAAAAPALEREKAWAGAFTDQTGQLGKANGRTGDTIYIVERCEALANEARPKR